MWLRSYQYSKGIPLMNGCKNSAGLSPMRKGRALSSFPLTVRKDKNCFLNIGSKKYTSMSMANGRVSVAT